MATDHASASANGGIVASMAASRAVLWNNPARIDDSDLPEATIETWTAGVADAERRFADFAPLLASLFADLAPTRGRIDSTLHDGAALAHGVGLSPDGGALYIKGDHDLPVAGSIKARGGIHAVLAHAEAVARNNGLLEDENFAALSGEGPRTIFGRHRVFVGSTGNLGLSVGTMAAALGFTTIVHMSVEAKGWKKRRLLDLGVEVVEHAGDYETALGAGRAAALDDANGFFVDDEASLPLIYGYATGAAALARQLAGSGIIVDATHPLFVYLPCGVGGAPAGVALGLRLLFGASVHCFYAEPVEAPCVLLQLVAPGGAHPSVYDAGLTCLTEADGLAVPRASLQAVEIARPVLSGVYTVEDEQLLEHLYLANRACGLRLEPSAAAGLGGPALVTNSAPGRDYIAGHGLRDHMASATHVAWATGGRLIPDDAFADFLERGRHRHVARSAPAPTRQETSNAPR